MGDAKSEALKCIQSAKRFVDSGNLDKARLLLLRAEKIYPTNCAKDLLQDITDLENDMKCGSNDSEKTNHYAESKEFESQGYSSSWNEAYTNYKSYADFATSSENLNDDDQATSSTKSSKTHENHHQEPFYTKDQIESVRKVRSCKDYYEILALNKDATDDDLKRAYKKLALRFHPDKNKAPGATEAFKLISNAFAVLSNPEKRARYDRYGTVEDAEIRRPSQYGSQQFYEFNPEFESDISAEELFNMFFGGGFRSSYTFTYRDSSGRQYKRMHQPQRRRSRTYTFNRDQHHRENNYYMCLQLLPILLLFAMSFLSGFFVKEPVYSLQKTNKFMLIRHTSSNSIPYFVKTSFEQDFKGSLPDLERDIEEQFVNSMRYNCYHERHYKEQMLYRARFYMDNEAFKQASNLGTPSCDKLTELFGQ